MKFSINDFFSKCDQIRSVLRIWSHSLKNADLVTFTQEILNGKLHFLCSDMLYLGLIPAKKIQIILQAEI